MLSHSKDMEAMSLKIVNESEGDVKANIRNVSATYVY